MINTYDFNYVHMIKRKIHYNNNNVFFLTSAIGKFLRQFWKSFFKHNNVIMFF